MNLSDFEPEPGESTRFSMWRAKRTLVTPSFTVRMRVWSPAGAPPTGQAIGPINRPARPVPSRPAPILGRIYDDYEDSAGNEDWMRFVGVPTGLAPDGLPPHFGPVPLTATPPGSFEADHVINIHP